MEGGAGASAPHASALTSAKEKEGITQNAGNNSTSEANSSELSTSTDESDPDYSLGNGRTTNAVKRKRKRKHRMQYTERWNGRRIRKVKRRQIQIQEEDLQGSTLLVHCGQVKGVLYKEKLAAGISQKSIKSSDGKWFTPPEFEAEGERESWKSWKRSIRHKGLPLEKLIVSGYLPNPKRIYGRRKKVKNPSISFCESAQFQSSASSLGCAILRSVHEMKRLFQNTFGNRKALQVKLQDINGHLIGLRHQHADLKKALDRCSRLDAALDVLTLQKQMNSIIEHQMQLETLVLKILTTLGVERS
uniref:nuclear body protein SP140-like protein isoform X3 n=1 Tax=Podarcis muralis TaxID=64176 RepID=UPI00109F23F1|nr:nuclear body protein SP140-like protein isoform X3 [Podarcis muralis]